MLQILKDPFCKTGCAIIRRYKGPEQIGRSSLCQFARFIKKVSRGSIKPEKAESLWLAARESIGLRGGEEARHERLCSQLALLEDLERHRERALGQMRRQLSELPEASSILSIPGLGLLTVGILLGECGNPACFHSYAAFEKFIGLNLFERSSGEHQGKRHISKRGRPRARYCVCEAAVFQLSKNGLFYEYAQEHPCAPGEKGKLRVAVARKLLKVIYALAKNRTLFDRARFFRFTGVRADHDQDIHQGTRLTVSAA
jgi:transposase